MKDSNKIEVKDTVKVHLFEGITDRQSVFVNDMNWIVEHINAKTNEAFINGYYWPLSSLTLVSKAPESDLRYKGSLKIQSIYGAKIAIEFNSKVEVVAFENISGWKLPEFDSDYRFINCEDAPIISTSYSSPNVGLAYHTHVKAWEVIAANSHESDKGEVRHVSIEKEITPALAAKGAKRVWVPAKDIIKMLEYIKENPSLWKVGYAGGQDQYAGMPPAIREIDAIIERLK